MNLKENYNRFFGKIQENKEEIKQPLNEAMKQRFANLSSMLSRKYPNAPLTMKNGFIYIGSKKIEESNKFLSRTSLNIQELVRSISASGKKGLI